MTVTLAVSMGDPAGIGPEVVVKALADPKIRRGVRWIVLGLSGPMMDAARAASIAPYWTTSKPGTEADVGEGVTLIDYADEPNFTPMEFAPGDSGEAGNCSLRFVNDAISLCLPSRGTPAVARGVVTAPISKAAWMLAGERRYPGHTELFADRCGVTRYAMMFASPKLNVILVTAHIPLAAVPGALTTERVLRAIELGEQGVRAMGLSSPRIGVCGLNPHAGERGLLGDQDVRIIAPAVAAARAKGIDAQGPFPADTIYLRPFDLIVAMYHDQGLIPLKLLARDAAVNLTVGLPIIRTSPDHGTAFDIAGKNLANPGSMRAACELALRLAAS